MNSSMFSRTCTRLIGRARDDQILGQELPQVVERRASTAVAEVADLLAGPHLDRERHRPRCDATSRPRPAQRVVVQIPGGLS